MYDQDTAVFIQVNRERVSMRGFHSRQQSVYTDFRIQLLDFHELFDRYRFLIGVIIKDARWVTSPILMNSKEQFNISPQEQMKYYVHNYEHCCNMKSLCREQGRCIDNIGTNITVLFDIEQRQQQRQSMIMISNRCLVVYEHNKILEVLSSHSNIIFIAQYFIRDIRQKSNSMGCQFQSKQPKQVCRTINYLQQSSHSISERIYFL